MTIHWCWVRPTLVDDLVQIIDLNLRERYTPGKEDLLNSLKIRRSLKLLNGVLKEFSAVKLPNGVKIMAQVRQWFTISLNLLLTNHESYQIVARLRPLLYDYYARMSVTFSAGGITLENRSSERISEDILLSHLVYKCLVKIGVWLWSKLGKCTEEERTVNFNWVTSLLSKRFCRIADSLTSSRNFHGTH